MSTHSSTYKPNHALMMHKIVSQKKTYNISQSNNDNIDVLIILNF